MESEMINSGEMKNFMDKLKNRKIEKERLVSNYDYIKWIEKFTEEHQTFFDDSWSYKKDEITKENLENVKKLTLFFDGLIEYCEKAWIEIQSYETSGEFVPIQYNGTRYIVGIVIGQGASAYVEREDATGSFIKDFNAEFIDFSDVVNNVLPKNISDKMKKVQELSSLIEEMKALKVPYEKFSHIIKKYYRF